MDTKNDYRILVSLEACGRLEKRIRGWSLPWPIEKGKALNAVVDIHKALLKLRYSFLPYEMILESRELSKVVEKTRQLHSLLFPRESKSVHIPAKALFPLAEIKYALSILLGMPYRVKLGEENMPEFAVDVIGAEVVEVDNLTSDLKVTRASTGSFALTVVTNIKDIRRGEVRAIAILPPVEFHGVISEAMYASSIIPRSLVGRRVNLEYIDSHVRAAVIDLARSVK
ncbi:MAG: tRNA-binding protein [Desulfurococcales archaeon]|nr:tRNA-binding protein [Desulfurococcales archaeon]